MMTRLLFVILFTNINKIRVSDADCNVIPMTEWSGAASLREDPFSTPIDLVVIQHTALDECMTDEECVSRVKEIQKIHVESNKFTDIGNSFYVGGNGKVYEGAGWSLVGAHTLRYNNRAVGVSFIGDFRDKLPTVQALEAAQNLISCGVQNNHLIADYHLVGHMQVSDTRSPGGTLQDHIESWPHWLSDVNEL